MQQIIPIIFDYSVIYHCTDYRSCINLGFHFHVLPDPTLRLRIQLLGPTEAAVEITCYQGRWFVLFFAHSYQ
jgi:hypothetical protein